MNVRDLRAIDRGEMVGLATTEYDRLVSLLGSLDPHDWERPTVCDGWSVHAMVAHLLGAAEANASQLENARQSVRGLRRARAMGRTPVDGINEVQIDARRHLGPDELVTRLEAIAPAAVRGRRRTPGPIRRIRVPGPHGRISLGHLVDVIYTRDQWMHRIDLSRATGRELVMTAGHDGRIVADIVLDWALTHADAFVLELTGPAGGTYQQDARTPDTDGPALRLDAVDFCLAVSGREPAHGLLAVPVTF